MEFITGAFVVGGLLYLLYKLIGDDKDLKKYEKMKETKGITNCYMLNHVGGHHLIEPGLDIRLDLTRDGILMLSNRFTDEFLSDINIMDIIECNVQTSEQVKNNASFAKTLMWGAGALRDEVITVQYLTLRFTYQNQEINCIFKPSKLPANNFTKITDSNMAAVAFEVNKMREKDNVS